MSMKKKPSLAVNAFLNTFKTIATTLMSLITFPYATRVLGVEAIGMFDFSRSFINYAVLFSGLGIAAYSIRECSQFRDDPIKVKQFVSEMFSIGMIATAISYILLFGAVAFIPTMNRYGLIISILSIEIISNTLGCAWIGNIYEDFLYITIRTLLFQVVYLGLLLSFVHSPEDIYLYTIISTITTSCSYLANYFYLRKKYVRFSFTFRIDWRKHLKPILVIFSTKIAITIYVNSDTTMLGFFTNDFEVGLYSTAVRIYSIIKEVLSAMVTVLIPRFAKLLNTGNKDESNELFSRIFSVFSMLIIPASIGLFVMSDEVVGIIAGADYSRASECLRILSVAIIIALYSNIFTTCILVPAKKENVAFVATVISAIMNISLNFVMIPLWGINAAATTTVIAELIVFIVSLWGTAKIVTLVGVRRNIVSIIVPTGLMTVYCVFIKNSVSQIGLKLIIAVVGSLFIYGVGLLVLKNDIAYDTLKLIKNNIRNKQK